MNRRTRIILATFAIVAGAAVVLGVGLFVLDFVEYRRSQDARLEHLIQVTQLEALTNKRDNLYHRIRSEEARDCPIQYLRDLVTASRAREDITAVEPRCESENLEALKAQLVAVERDIARHPANGVPVP